MGGLQHVVLKQVQKRWSIFACVNHQTNAHKLLSQLQPRCPAKLFFWANDFRVAPAGEQGGIYNVF
jgi:hypothetical protein